MNDVINWSKDSPAKMDQTKTDIKCKHPRRSASAQLLATLIQNWLFIDLGLEMGVPTLIIGALHRNSNDALRMDDDQASWFGSIPNFCFPLASLASAFIQELIGRKGAMILVNIPRFAAWITLYTAQSVHAFYIAAAVMGICSGLSEASLHSYIGEIGEPRLRGTLSSISSSGFFVGSLTAFILGYFFDWRTVALISSACPVITLILMTQIPESPTWLIVRNRLDEAKKSLCWLRGWVKPQDVEEEFQSLVNYLKKSIGTSSHDHKLNSSTNSNIERPLVGKAHFLMSQIKVLASKAVLLPLRMVFIIFVISSGANIRFIRPFFIGELNNLGSNINPKLVLVMLNVVYFVGSMMNVALLRRFGKRKLALFSHGLSAAFILSLGAFCSFSYHDGNFHKPEMFWLPLSLLTAINLVDGIGITNLPWQLTCEVFPPMGRGLASGISASWAKLVFSVMVKSFLYLEAWMDLSGVMYLYAGLTILGTVYYYLHLPETEGKSLEQIESYFTKNHDRKEKIDIGQSLKSGRP